MKSETTELYHPVPTTEKEYIEYTNAVYKSHDFLINFLHSDLNTVHLGMYSGEDKFVIFNDSNHQLE